MNGREPELLFGNKWELKYSIRFPKAGNGNKVMGMGGNGYTKVIPAYLYNAPVSVYWATLIQKSWPSSHSLAGGGRVRHDRRWSPSDVEQIEHRIDSPTSQSWFITHCRLISVVRGGARAVLEMLTTGPIGLNGDSDIAFLSVCLSVRDVPVLDENGLTYCHGFFAVR